MSKEGTWKIEKNSLAALRRLERSDGIDDATQRIQDLMMAVKEEHGIVLTALADSGDDDDMIVLGSTETGEALDDDERRAAGIGPVEMELGKSRSKVSGRKLRCLLPGSGSFSTRAQLS